MADLLLNEEPSVGVPARTSSSGVTGLIIRLGLAKDQKSAQTVMIVIVALCILVSGLIVFLASPSGPKGKTLSPEEGQRAFQEANGATRPVFE